MKKKAIISILALYETFSTGETIATENILTQFKKSETVRVKAHSFPSLKYTNIFYHLSWIVNSVLFFFKKIVQSKNVDWVYTTTFTAGFAAIFLMPLKKYRIAFHYHGTRMSPRPDTSANIFTYSSMTIRYVLTSIMHWIFLKNAEVIFVPAEETKQDLLKQFSYLDGQKIITIPNGISHNAFRPTSRSQQMLIRKKLKLPQNKKILLSIGRLEDRKNVHELIRVFHKLLQISANYVLLIAYPKLYSEQETAYLNNMRNMIRHLGLTNKIYLFENYHQIHALYAVSDLVISLSKHESFPLTLLETWSTGTIFMGTPVGATTSLLSEINGQLIIRTKGITAIANQIQKVMQLPAQQHRKYIASGYKLSRKFSWQRTSDLIIDFFQEEIEYQ